MANRWWNGCRSVSALNVTRSFHAPVYTRCVTCAFPPTMRRWPAKPAGIFELRKPSEIEELEEWRFLDKLWTMWDCFGSEDPETEVGRIVHLSQMRAASLRIRAPDPTWDRTFLHGNLRVLCPLHLLPDHSRCRQVVDCTHSSRQRMLLVHHCFRAMIGTVGCCWKDSPNSKSAIRGHPHRSQADRWCRTLRSWNTIRH